MHFGFGYIPAFLTFINHNTFRNSYAKANIQIFENENLVQTLLRC